jgi:hypothetical protein
LTLQVAGQSEMLPLANCVLLTERGGRDTQHSGRAILWTPALGLEVFRSIEHARQVLDQRLADPQKRLMLLENLFPRHQGFHQHYAGTVAIDQPQCPAGSGRLGDRTVSSAL